LLIYMLNYLLFLSMVHEYAYFVMNIFGKRSIKTAYLYIWTVKTVLGMCTIIISNLVAIFSLCDNSVFVLNTSVTRMLH